MFIFSQGLCYNISIFSLKQGRMAINLLYKYKQEPGKDNELLRIRISPAVRSFAKFGLLFSFILVNWIILYSKVIDYQAEKWVMTRIYEDVRAWQAKQTAVTILITEEEKSLVKEIDMALSKELSGYILLQEERNNEAWYVYPDDLKKYFLGRPEGVGKVMAKLGLGATHDFITSQTKFPVNVLGKILIDTEDNGKAYYIYPKDRKAYYLGEPEAALAIMRALGKDINNADIRKIDVGNIELVN